LGVHPGNIVGGAAWQGGVGALSGNSADDEVAQAFEEVFNEALRRMPGGDDLVDHPEE
jgi:hypothetical protein